MHSMQQHDVVDAWRCNYLIGGSAQPKILDGPTRPTEVMETDVLQPTAWWSDDDAPWRSYCMALYVHGEPVYTQQCIHSTYPIISNG